MVQDYYANENMTIDDKKKVLEKNSSVVDSAK